MSVLSVAQGAGVVAREPDSIVLTLEGDLDAEETDALYRRLRRDLEDDAGIDTSFVSEAAPDGSKTDVGVISGVMVPLAIATIPVLADKIHLWLADKRRDCTVVIHQPDGTQLRYHKVAPDEVDTVVAQHQPTSAIEPDGSSDA